MPMFVPILNTINQFIVIVNRIISADVCAATNLYIEIKLYERVDLRTKLIMGVYGGKYGEGKWT